VLGIAKGTGWYSYMKVFVFGNFRRMHKHFVVFVLFAYVFFFILYFIQGMIHIGGLFLCDGGS